MGKKTNKQADDLCVLDDWSIQFDVWFSEEMEKETAVAPKKQKRKPKKNGKEN